MKTLTLFADAVAVAHACADSDGVAGARAAASVHDAQERCAHVIERVEHLGVDCVDVAKRQRSVETSAGLPR